jgi:hypothetical protein
MTKFSIVCVVLGMTGVAIAGDAAKDSKTPVPAGKAEPPKMPPAPAMEAPKPAAEIAEMAKSMAGSWRCDGTSMGMDMKDAKFKGKMTTKVDLDGWWVHDSMEGTAGEGKTAEKFKMEAYTTYDASTKKWRRVAVMTNGGQLVGASDGMKDMKMDFALDSTSGMGAGMFKDHVDMSDMKKGAHTWGEMSMDKGKTWIKVYDMTCKK